MSEGEERIEESDLYHQKWWSADTFGPGMRTKGLIAHIRKELKEIRKDPTDLMEYIDVIILAIDGAWRAGYTPAQIIQAYHDKMGENYQREWPDWRNFSEDEAIEHVRDEGNRTRVR